MTTSTRSGIPTTYHETRFRSRLEARWAAFFDLVEWRWTYEPFDAAGWIPDFLIHGPRPLLVEVGPVATEAEYRTKAEKALAHLEHPTVVLGVSPVLQGHLRELPWTWAGLLVNEFAAGSAWLAEWVTCGQCDTIGLQDDGVLFPCDHGWTGAVVGDRFLDDTWAAAGNAVQWKR